MQTQSTMELMKYVIGSASDANPWKPKPLNSRSQATVRREVRRRSNLPKAIQKRLGFKCH